MKPIRSVFTLAFLFCFMVGSRLHGTDAGDAEFLGAIAKGDIGTVKAALARGAKPETRNEAGHTALIVAIKNGHVETARILLAAGASAVTPSAKGSPPLGFAAETGNVEMMRLLVEHGANIEAAGDIGDTPLISTAKFGRLEAARYLLDAGAEIDRRGPKDKNKHHINALWMAVVNGHLDVVKLLLDRGAEINATTQQDNVVMEAAKIPNPEMLKYLISRGANIHQRAGQSREALMYAAYNGRAENVRILIEAGARARSSDLEEASFEPGSEGYKLLSEAIARNPPEPPPRTVHDVENLRRKEPSAD